jgi:hypothetical protein
MARPLNLERVKQAWQLRKQGKQPREIAEALSLTVRHVQNYLSLDWLAQRSLRVLSRGRPQEANEQLKILWDLGGVPAGDGVARPHQVWEAAPQFEEAAERQPQQCLSQAPDPWPDVARLESWGVPKGEAPGLLSAWRRAHRSGSHPICVFWGQLTENVQAGIPFADAYELTIANWLADRWGFKLLKAVTELYRLYRPWEGPVHQKVYLEEVQSAISEFREEWVKLDEAGTDEPDALFQELPRRFLYGLQSRLAPSGHPSQRESG